MKTIFLLPPSEWKTSWWNYKKEQVSFNFEKPCEIARNVTEKDLKCSGKRFEEGFLLNKTLCEKKQKEFLEAIFRYSWVMYSAIDYNSMSEEWKKFFENNFLIFSWMYGILKPLDKIGNYKLPLQKADLYKFWWDKIPDTIIKLKPDYIVNLLPINYAKLIWLGTNCNRHKKKLEKILNAWIKIININFLKQPLSQPFPSEEKGDIKYKKISHWVKKIKWEWIRDICEKKIDFWNILSTEGFNSLINWEIIENWNIIDVNIFK